MDWSQLRRERKKHLKFCLYLLASPSVYLKIVLKLGWGLEWNRWAPKIGGRKYAQFNNVSFSTAHKKNKMFTSRFLKLSLAKLNDLKRHLISGSVPKLHDPVYNRRKTCNPSLGVQRPAKQTAREVTGVRAWRDGRANPAFASLTGLMATGSEVEPRDAAQRPGRAVGRQLVSDHSCRPSTDPQHLLPLCEDEIR